MGGGKNIGEGLCQGQTVTFWVPGRPRPQGSKRLLKSKSTGRVIPIESSKGLKGWRDLVRARASHAMEGRAPWDKTPVEILATFVLSRPKSHFGRGGVVRESAPLSPVTTPDLDKLIRGVLDAMSGPVYKDDSCVVTVHAAKVYGESEGLMVSVRPDERLWYHEEHVALNLSHRSKLVLV